MGSKRTRRGKSSGESGQYLVLGVVAMTVLLAFCALVIDVGLAFWQRRDLQTAADAAALAAAQDLLAGLPKDVARARAFDYMDRNGYDTSDTTITVNIPPQSGLHTGDSNYVEVKGSRQAPWFIVTLFREPFTVGARAVAGQAPTTALPFSFVSLRDDCLKHTLLVKAGGNLTVGGGIQTNSCNVEKEAQAEGQGDAFDIFGEGGSITACVAVAPPCDIKVVGGWEVHTTGVLINPWPLIHQPVVPDPLGCQQGGLCLPGPDITKLTVRSGSPSNPVNLNINSNTTLSPGVYYGGIKFDAKAAGTLLTLQAGIYYMAGGGFEVSGKASLDAPHVMIYNSNDPYSSSGAGQYKGINLSTQGNVTLGPPQSGPYRGMTIFQDRNNPNAIVLAPGNGINGLSGTIYAPHDDALANVKGSGVANLQLMTGMMLIDGGNATFLWKPEGLFDFGSALVE